MMIKHRYSDRNSLFRRLMTSEKRRKTSPFATDFQLRIICLGKIKQQYNVIPYLSYTVICWTIANIGYSTHVWDRQYVQVMYCLVMWRIKYVIVRMSYLFVSYIYTQFKVWERLFGIRILFTGSLRFI